MTARWARARRAATAAELHGDWPAERDRRALALCRVEGPPALVLGSTQPAELVDADASIEVVRRRSGGGAVLVAPGAQVWVEAWVPRRDPLWEDDVVRGAWWLGELWADALARCGAPHPLVHRGRAVVTPWSGTICFAGIGPGEVAVEGRKVVGLSQRRTRDGARLHSMALVDWDPLPLVALLALDDEARARVLAETAAAAAGLAAVCPGAGDAERLLDAVEDAVLEALADRE
ncbi:MAG: lipoyl protein ligase domain-containing protein [Acidimicrobiales bacterium]